MDTGTGTGTVNGDGNGDVDTGRAHGADAAVRELDVGWLVNATGPGADVTRDPLLARLVADGVVRPDRLRLGLDAAPGGAVLDASGAPDDRIFTLGPMLRGSLYETTAIPEIRAQAAALAPRLVETVVSAARRDAGAVRFPGPQVPGARGGPAARPGPDAEASAGRRSSPR